MTCYLPNGTKRPILDVNSSLLIYIWNVPKNVTISTIKTCCQRYGPVRFVETFEAWQKKKIGQVIVQFADEQGLENFVDALSRKEILDYQPAIEFRVFNRQFGQKGFFDYVKQWSGVDLLGCNGIPPEFDYHKLSSTASAPNRSTRVTVPPSETSNAFRRSSFATQRPFHNNSDEISKPAQSEDNHSNNDKTRFPFNSNVEAFMPASDAGNDNSTNSLNGFKRGGGFGNGRGRSRMTPANGNPVPSDGEQFVTRGEGHTTRDKGAFEQNRAFENVGFGSGRGRGGGWPRRGGQWGSQMTAHDNEETKIGSEQDQKSDGENSNSTSHRAEKSDKMTNGGFNLDDGANLEKNKNAIAADFGHSNKDDKEEENGKDGEEEQEITAINGNINRGENSEASAAHPVNSNSWPRMAAETSDHRTSSQYSQYREKNKADDDEDDENGKKSGRAGGGHLDTLLLDNLKIGFSVERILEVLQTFGDVTEHAQLNNSSAKFVFLDPADAKLALIGISAEGHLLGTNPRVQLV